MLKKTIFLVLIMSTMIFAQAQSYIEILKSDIKTQSRALITAAMEFSEEEAEKFWPVYKEYEVENDQLMDQEINLIKEYAENYEKMTDEMANQLINKSFAIEKEQLKSLEKYYTKFKDELGGKRAAKLTQVINRINLMINLQKASNVPVFE